MHTPEQRDRHILCGARKKNGDLCRKFAGEGTNHRGVGRCKYHLGRTENHEKHAAKVEAAERMEKLSFGRAVDIEPSEALLAVLHLSYGHLCWLRSEIGLFEDTSVFEAQVLLRMFADERDRVARIGRSALDAGVQERQIKLAERWGETLAQLLQGIFADPELAITARQQAQLPSVLRRHLIAIDADATRVELPTAS